MNHLWCRPPSRHYFVTVAKFGNENVSVGAYSALRRSRQAGPALRIDRMSNKHSVDGEVEVLPNTIYPKNMAQGRPSNTALKKKQSLALTRQLSLEARKASRPAIIPPNPNSNNAENLDVENESSSDEIKCTGRSGGVIHYVSSDRGPIFISDDDREEEVEELSGSELEDAIRQCGEGLVGMTTVKQVAARTTVGELPAAQPIAEDGTPSVLMD